MTLMSDFKLMLHKEGDGVQLNKLPSKKRRPQREAKVLPLANQGVEWSRLRPSQLCLAIALALAGHPALAQDAGLPSADSTENTSTDGVQTLEAMTIVGAAEEEKKIGNTAGASKEDIERRKASHMTELLDSISGVSTNSLYAAPEISTRVQGIAGHGRVAQSLEGINQNFHAFTRDIGQTGSIFVDPQFLKSIDVTRGGSTGTSALGSLGGSVDFKYLDVEDILRPGKSFGGMVRGSTGFSKYRNGEKPSGSLFLGGRSERWEVMIGAAESENDAYRIGQSFDRGAMLRDAHGENMKFFKSGSPVDPWAGVICRYCVAGRGGMGSAMANRQLTEQQLGWLKQAADEPLKGTQKKTDAQMLRLRHFFNDDYDQRLELFATANSAKYETDQQPSISVAGVNEQGEGKARWHDYPWSIGAELESQVISLKYAGNFSQWLNPEIQLYHESQERKQRWIGYPGSSSVGEALHYFVDIGSTGLKLSNASHFDAGLLGPLRLDAGIELRRADKDVDSLSDGEYWEQRQHSRGYTDYRAPKWDTDARTDTYGFALALSTEGDGPWQASAGVGYQRVKLDALNPVFTVGNIKQGGTLRNYQYWNRKYRLEGYSRDEASPMATEKAAESSREILKDPSKNMVSELLQEGKQEHTYSLKSGHFSLQYSPPDTGLSTYASVSYNERAPSSNEMYMSGAWLRTHFNANPYLKPEENLSFQIGANYQSNDWLVDNDQLSVGLNYYHNRIKNYITYGPVQYIDGSYGSSNQGEHVSSINNLNAFHKHGLEFNLAYQQPLFYVRGNLTVPLRWDNKICSWENPHGRGYQRVSNPDGSVTLTPYGKGDRPCYSSWNWMETGAIDPVRASFTAALTPYQGKLEVGATVHYRGKQRAAYWFDPNISQNSYAQDNSNDTLPTKADFITANLWPKSIKYDLFASYQFNDQLKAGVYVANLTDEIDATTTTFGYNFYPGRTVTANLEYRF